jgi:hypothetical protein
MKRSNERGKQMKSATLPTVILLLVGFWPMAASACDEDPNMRLMVKYIGEICDVGGSDWLFPEFAKEPRKAICSLVTQLNTTTIREIAPWESEQKMEASRQVWRIRALRFLTCGLDFTATTPFLPDEVNDPVEYWERLAGALPGRNKLGEPVWVSFFHTWMTWAVDHVAPVDAQTEIIHQWREWQVKNGTNTGCTPDPKDYNQWYF